MKRKSRKPKTRIPMPPPQKPHSTKKGKRGYERKRGKRTTFKEKEEEKMSGLYKEGAMTEEARRQETKDNYRAALRNLSLAQVALVEKRQLSPDEEKEIRASGLMSYARQLFLELPMSKERPLSPFC